MKQTALMRSTDERRNVTTPGRVAVFRVGDVTLIALSGEHDPATEFEVYVALEAARSLGSRRIIVDLTAATFIDSTVLGAIAAACSHMEASPKHASITVIAKPDTPIDHTLRVAGIDRRVRIVADVADAPASSAAQS